MLIEGLLLGILIILLLIYTRLPAPKVDLKPYTNGSKTPRCPGPILCDCEKSIPPKNTK